MDTSKVFIEFFESSYQREYKGDIQLPSATKFFAEFVNDTPLKLEKLEDYLNKGQVDQFYQLLIELKYLVEFSDDLNRYWHVLRAYSEGLMKLKADLTAKGSKRLYTYYFDKYGDRRSIRHEHWFENKRWEFLDELQNLYSDDKLHLFVMKYEKVLLDDFRIFVSHVIEIIKGVNLYNSRVK
jgi:hypothetical protein